MKILSRTLILGSLAVLAIGCAASAPVPVEKPSSPLDPIIEMVDQDFREISANIDGMRKRLGDLEKMPESPDPIPQELRGIHLAGWQLQLQQMVLQRDHLKLAKDLLVKARENPDQKREIAQQWIQHRKDYDKAIEDLRGQRRELELKLVQVEARLIEQALQ